MEPDLAVEPARRPGLTPVQVIAAGLMLVAVGIAVWAVQDRPVVAVEEVELLAVGRGECLPPSKSFT